MTAKDLMVEPVISVPESESLLHAAGTMLQNQIGCLPVVDAKGDLSGIITQSDFATKDRAVPFSMLRFPQLFGEWLPKENIERMYRECRELPASSIMSRPVVQVCEDDTIGTVLERMLRHDINHVVVTRDRKPLGIISRFDLLKLMLENAEQGRVP